MVISAGKKKPSKRSRTGLCTSLTAIKSNKICRSPFVQFKLKNAQLSRPDAARIGERRQKERSHRHRHAVRIRRATALRLECRLPVAHDEESTSQVDHPRAAVVLEGRHEYQVSEGQRS